MELSIQVFNQVLVIFILMAVGLVLYKTKIFTEAGTAQATKILLTIVMPSVIINAFQTDFDTELLISLMYATLVSIALHIIAILLGKLFFYKKTDRNIINIFSSVYSNCGFMGFPLLTAVFGKEGILYGSAYFTIFTIFSWTHGLFIFAKDKAKFDIKKILLNPGIIGVVIGLLLFFARVRLPYVLSESVNYISMLNTPLAMLILGTHMAKIKISDITDKFNLLIVTLIKLVIVPVAGILIANLFGITGNVTGAVIISASCPTAAMATLFAAQNGNDAVYATVTVVITTLLSVITIPLLTLLI